ncbi:MAG: glycosyltransferase [Candidatus Cloacimonadia bacterium]
MKFVQVGPVYPYRGGIAHFAGCLHKQLIEDGHDSVVITFQRQYPELIFPGKGQTEDNDYFKDIKAERVLTPYDPTTYHKTYKAIVKHKPDYVIFQFFLPYFVPSYSYLLKRLRRKGIKTIVVTHNIDFHEKWPFANFLTRQLLIKADYILTLSNSVFVDAIKNFSHWRRYKKSNPVQESKAKNCDQIIYHLDKRDIKIISSFHPLYEFHNRNAYSTDKAKEILNLKGKDVILFFGYIKPYKGVEMLIKSLPHIKKKLPNAVLLIVGEIYGDDQQYHSLIENSEFKEDIVLMDEYVSDNLVELYFKAGDTLALPYIQATQSGVVQIAYVMNIGVVVTPVGGLPEMVIDGKTGMVTSSVDEADFAEGIIKYFELDKQQVKDDIAEYRANLSWKKFVSDMIEAL